MSDRLPKATAAMTVTEPVPYVLQHYHEAHRRDLPPLIALAGEVERGNALHPSLPHGLSDALILLRLELEDHMRREECELFPVLLAGSGPVPARLAHALCHDHEFQDEAIRMIHEMTDGFMPPEDASSAWRQLYAATARFLLELLEHTRIENEILLRAPLAAA